MTRIIGGKPSMSGDFENQNRVQTFLLTTNGHEFCLLNFVLLVEVICSVGLFLLVFIRVNSWLKTFLASDRKCPTPCPTICANERQTMMTNEQMELGLGKARACHSAN